MIITKFRTIVACGRRGAEMTGRCMKTSETRVVLRTENKPTDLTVPSAFTPGAYFMIIPLFLINI